MFRKMLGQMVAVNGNEVKNRMLKQQLMDSLKAEFSNCNEPFDVWEKLTRLGYSVDFTVCQNIYTYVNYGKINELMKVHNLPLIMNKEDYEMKLYSTLTEMALNAPRYA